MLQYKLTLYKEVKYYLAIMLFLVTVSLYVLDKEYEQYIVFLLGFLVGFAVMLFSVKRLFRIKLFNIYQDEVELSDKNAIMQMADYQKLFHITKVFLHDMRRLKKLEELSLRIDLYLKAFNAHEMAKEEDIAEFGESVKIAFQEIKEAVKKGEKIHINYPDILQEKFAKIIEGRLSKKNRDKLMEIKNAKV